MTESMPVCPEAGELAEFVERSLKAARVSEIREHLDHCEDCVEALLVWMRGSRLAGVVSGGDEIADIPSGTRVGAFEVRSLLGAGNLGRVYLARDTRLDRDVALKLLGVRRDHPAWADRLVTEAQTMAKVRHPNACTVHEVGRDGELVFVAMERVEGETLRALMDGSLAQGELLSVLAGAARGLAAAHDRGITHRDFKPDNVMVEPSGDRRRAVVCDFGLAAAGSAVHAGESADEPGKTSSDLIGTPAYMAPEQFDGAGIDHRADVFAFGVTAWEVLVGERPFRGMTIGDLRHAMKTLPGWPAGVDVNAKVRALVTRCLAEDPADRPASMLEVARALESALADRPGGWRWWAAGAAALISAAGAALALTSVGARSPADPCAGLEEAGWFSERDSWRAAAAERGIPRWLIDDLSATFDAREESHSQNHQRFCRGAERDPMLARLFAECQRTTLDLDAEYRSVVLEADWPRFEPVEMLAEELRPPSFCTLEEGLRAGVQEEGGLDREAAAEVQRRLLRALMLARGEASSPPWADELAAARILVAGVQTSSLAAEVAFTAASLEPAMPTLERDRQWREVAGLSEASGNKWSAARAWLRLAELWVTDEPGDRHAEHAIEQADWAIKRLGNPPRLRSAWHRTAGSWAWRTTDHKEARRHFQSAIDAAGSDPSAQRSIRTVMAKLAVLDADYAAAKRIYEEILADPRFETQSAADRARLYASYAEVLYKIDDLERGLEVIERSLALVRKELGPDDPQAGVHLLIRGMLELEQGSIEDCLASVEAGLAVLEPVYGGTHSTVAAAFSLRAAAQASANEFEAALESARQAYAHFTALYGERSESTIHAAFTVAENLRMLDRLAESRALYEENLEIGRAALGPEHAYVATAELSLAQLLHAQGQSAEAADLAERALSSLRSRGAPPPYVGQAEYALAVIVAESDPAWARELAASAFASWTGDPYWDDSAELARQLLAGLDQQR